VPAQTAAGWGIELKLLVAGWAPAGNDLSRISEDIVEEFQSVGEIRKPA